jgi:hypothetical protein
LNLVERQQLRDVTAVFRCNDTLPSGVVLEGLFSFLFVGHFGVMQEEALQQKMLNFEHVHLRPTANQLSRG